MIHASINKIDKFGETLATITANEFPQLTVLQFKRPIKVMSVQAQQPLTWR
jgi:hypothetical protein